jgi:hypothetical protein
VEGKFHGGRTTFHPAFRSGKGFEALGGRWNVLLNKRDVFVE